MIDRLVTVDQKPIGRTPRSNLATYTGMFDAVRKAFAGDRRGPPPRLERGPLLVQRRRGPVSDLPGRGLRRGRIALPARHLRALPDLPRGPLLRRDPQGPLSRSHDRRRPGDDRGRSRRVPRRRPRRGAESRPRCARSGWVICGSGSPPPNCPAARRSGSSWRRSCSGPVAGTPSTSSTSRPPVCTPPTSSCWSGNCTGWSTRATPSSSPNTTWAWWRERTG